MTQAFALGGQQMDYVAPAQLMSEIERAGRKKGEGK